MFSVIIPLYNKELSIKNTIQSVLNQTFQDFEIVIINDGSEDGSVKVINGINDERIRVIHQRNQGVSTARNRGIEDAKYEWIAFLDGDDIWKSKHLETVYSMIIEFPESKIFATNFEYSDGRKPFNKENVLKTFLIDNYFKEALTNQLIWTSIVVVNRSCFKEVGLFNPKLARGEDLDLWARLSKSYVWVKSVIVTAIYRLDAENRACENSSIYNKSIFSIIDLKGLKGDERFYFKNMLINRLKGNFKNFEFKEFFKILFKHNIEFVK